MLELSRCRLLTPEEVERYEAWAPYHYKQPRKINPEAARQAVPGYLNTNGRNIAEAACAFGIHRAVIYDILGKQKEGNLQDRSKAPKYQPTKPRGRLSPGSTMALGTGLSVASGLEKPSEAPRKLPE